MNDDAKLSIGTLLKEEKEDFLHKWERKVLEAVETGKLSPHDKNAIDRNEFGELFDAYVDDMLNDTMMASQQLVMRLVRSKVRVGFSLSMLEFINASFMATAREVFRQAYPDAFNTRMEYLERLSQMVLSNEIALAQYYEEYLNDLNMKLREKAESLQRRNEALMEFMDLATHELQSPLWSILGFVAKLQRTHNDVLDEKGKHCLDRISTNVSEMHQLIEDLTAIMMADRDDMVPREVLLTDVLREAEKRVLKEVDERFQCKGISASPIRVNGDPRHLKQAFFQIMKNAAIYTHQDNPGCMRLWWSNGDKVFHIYFEDRGIGIDEKYRALVFEPMERLKEKDVPGSGMGLTFARRVFSAHGGTISIKEGTEGGACVHVELPEDIVRAENE